MVKEHILQENTFYCKRTHSTWSCGCITHRCENTFYGKRTHSTREHILPGAADP
jgi:hypothetical protein